MTRLRCPNLLVPLDLPYGVQAALAVAAIAIVAVLVVVVVTGEVPADFVVDAAVVIGIVARAVVRARFQPLV